MREIIFDTETTGLNCEQERIVEIGCVELIHRELTGNTFHYYINPEKEISPEVVKIHGITNEKVKDAPLFKDIAEEFLTFIEGATLVAHNAVFDMGFINSELQRMGKDPLDTVLVIDTLKLTRQKFPRQKNTLDALCQRYKIDLSARELHGALLDSQLLAEVYLKLLDVVDITNQEVKKLNVNTL